MRTLSTRYKGHIYRHQQIWGLIRELRKNGVTVLLRNGKSDDVNEWFVSALTAKKVYSARAETPFTALSRAVRKLEGE